MNHRWLAVLFLLYIPTALAGWTHLRGPEIDGSIDAPGTFDGKSVGLDVAWRAPVGSAYAGVVVDAGRAVTMFADAEADWVAAFDAATGEPIWQRRLGPATHGHDGSHDGPLSSPVLGNERVFALSPNGRLVALRLKDGKVVWERRLEKTFGSMPPEFGFTTTPLVDGDRLIVQTGGPGGRSIAALNTRNGKTIWTSGDARVSYQSPALMTLAGRPQIVAVAEGLFTGLDSATGEELWSYELGEGDRVGSSSPTSVGESRFLVKIGGKVGVFRVSRAEGKFRVEELYRSDALGGRNYAPPVYHDGHIYGFRGQVLTCMNASDGERVWRSRPPGGDGLILVDRHLVVFGAKGNVVVVRATPDGYDERARLQALAGSSLTWPSFDSGRVFVRNLEELVAVDVTRTDPASEPEANAGGEHAFGRWLREVEATEARQELVDRFFERRESLPLVEDDQVHFIFRSPAADVGIAGSMNETSTAEPMQHVAGTDLFHRTYRLEPGGRWEYRFQVDFEAWVTDPHNPRTVPAVEGEETLSEWVAPGYRQMTFVDDPERARGSVEQLTLASEILGYDKTIQVWLPPGYHDHEAAYPLLIVNDGKAWLEKGGLTDTLDHLVGTEIRPVVVAFVEAHGEWWIEGGGSRTGDYVRMQVDELLPMLAERYRLESEPGSRAVMGNRFFAISSAYAALEHPEVFGKVAMQSAVLGLGAEDAVAEMIGAARGASTLGIYFDWNRYDQRNIDRGWDAAENSRALARMLREGGYRMDGGEVLDSHGWGGWRNRSGRLLKALFPLPER